MEKRRVLMDVLDFCKRGKFKESLNTLKNIDGEINNEWITSFLTACYNVCIDKKTLENISEIDLHCWLLHIASHMKCMNEFEAPNYLQPIFYILKFFTQSKCCQLLAKMESVLVPSFLPLSLPRDQIVTYEASANLLYHFIVKTDYKEFKSLIEICNTMSKMYARSSNVTTLFNTSFNCALHLSSLLCPIQYLEEYYFNVLNLAKLDNMEVNSESHFKTFLFFFCLIYRNMLIDLDFENAIKLYERTVENGIEIFNNDDCTHVLILMRFPLALSPFPFEDKLESLVKCRQGLSLLDSVAIKQLVGNKLRPLIYSVVFSNQSLTGLEWNKLSETCQLEFLQFIWEISRLELLSKYSCSCKCPIEQNVYDACSYSDYINKLLEMCVRRENTSNNFNKKGANLLARFGEDVKILKDYNCEKWKIAWKALGIALYNTGVHLHQNSDQDCMHYFYNVIKYFIIFERNDLETILKFSVIGSAFSVLYEYNIKDYKKCLALSALAMKSFPNQRNIFIVNWIKAKASQRDAKTAEGNDVQMITLVSAFKCLKKEMEFLTHGEHSLTTADKIDLLVYELEQYKKKWKSKIPMMSAFKELCELADVTKIVEVIVTIFGDSEVMLLHDDLPKMIQTVLKKYDKKISGSENATLESTILLAFLHYMDYKFCFKDVITKNTDDMERTMSVTQKTDEPPDAFPKDPNEKCDIVSFYDSLKLSRYFVVMKHLNKSLHLLSSVIKDNFNMSSLTKITYSMLYNLLMKISYEYRLHRHIVRTLQALQLALNVALSENSPCDIVQTIGFIVENSDVKKSYLKSLFSIADKQLDNIKYTSVENVKAVLIYYVCKAKSLLYEDYKEAFRIFQMANDLYEKQEDKIALGLIKSHLHVLHLKFVLMPCKLGIVDHKKSTLLTIHLANSAVYEVNNTSKLDDSYEISLLLYVGEEIARLYHLLQCPREVRSYCKAMLVLAQRLVLPIQCAYYLVYLAHADLRSSRFNDCQVKIEGLADILCLTTPLYNIQSDQENIPPKSCVEINKDIIDLTSGMQEIVLDLPISSNYKKQFSPSSPALIIQPFRLPAFVHHEDGCDCFCCMSLEYQYLVLEKTRLDALLNVKQNNYSISNDFFHSALNLYEHCSRKYDSYTETLAKFLSYDLIPDLKNELLEVYGSTLLNYSCHLMRTKDKTEALKTINKTIDLVSVRKMEYIYLYNEALFQKLGYMTDIPSIAMVGSKALEKESFGPSTSVVPTTPESKQSKVTFPVQYNPSFSPPKRRVKKCLPFNLSPSQDTCSNNKSQDKTSPASTQPKTPLPKIKIYSNDDTELKAKNTVKKAKDKKKAAVYEDSCSSIVCNGAISTPVIPSNVDSESGLRTRTKLLTNKLRQSAKKPGAPVNGNEQPEVSNCKKKLSLRKNLFEQVLVDIEASRSQSGAIRKSSRNRKV